MKCKNCNATLPLDKQVAIEYTDGEKAIFCSMSCAKEYTLSLEEKQIETND